MTIPRSKRPPRPARSGRPRKLNTPPSAIGGLNVTLDLFNLADLQELANATGLSLVSNSRSLWAVSAINEAFSNYANTTAMQIDDSPAGERRDWCAGIAKASDELRRGLGHLEDCLFMQPSAFDAGESLVKGWPADPQTPEAHAMREALQSALSFAMPDKHKHDEAKDLVANPDNCMWGLLGRLGPALHALALIAKAAEDAWGAETVRGRGSKDRGRRYFMELLVPTFVCLFEQKPTATPGSNGFRWFSALITRAGQIAGEQRALFDPGEPEEEQQARTAALQAVEAVAQHIAPLPYETATKGTARLDHWIRDAIAAAGIKQTKVATEPASPDLPNTREPKAETRE